MFCYKYVLTISGFLLCAAGVNSGCSDPLGVENEKKITDSQMSVSSFKSKDYEGFYGRLNNDKSWCPEKTNDRQWLQVDFNETKTITAVKTQAAKEDPFLYVESFALLYSYEGIVWYNYTIDMKVIVLPGQNTPDDKTIPIPYPITAKFIRINPRTWPQDSGGFCLRVEFYGCSPKEDCFTPVGMEDGRIEDSQVTASSTYRKHFPYRGRLNNKTKNRTDFGAWCTDHLNQNQYLQIDLIRKRNISAVATQGYMYNMFVEKYKLNYSTDGKTWMSCRNERGKIEFTGNKDNMTIKESSVYPPVTAKYIRFNPTKWFQQGYICMRVEVYECLPVKGSVPKVHKELPRFSDVDKGGSINLTCVMEAQADIIIKWFKRNVRLQPSNTARVKTTAIREDRMESTLFLSNVKMDANGIKYQCRGSYRGVNSFFSSTTTVLRVGADQPPLSADSKTADTLVLYVPYQKSKVTKTYLFEYKPANSTVEPWTSERFSSNQEKLYTIKGLKAWTYYQVRVTPIHEHDIKGRTSVTAVFQTAQGVPSTPPRMIKVVHVNEYNVTISWQPPHNENIHGKIEKYVIKTNSEDKTDIMYKPVPVDVQKGTTYTIEYLLPNTHYNFSISCVTGGGEGPYSGVHFFTTAKENELTTTTKPRTEEVDLEKLNKINITEKNVIRVASDVKNLTSETELLKPKDVALTAEILEKIVKTNNKDPKVGDSILETISQVIDVKTEVLDDSNARNNTSSKFVKILEEYVEKGGRFSRNTSNIIVRVDRILEKHSVGVKKEFGKNASIEIPGEVLDDAENKTMYFIYYKNGKLFRGKRLVKEICLKNGFTENVYQVSTPVLSSSISGETVNNLSERVILRFTVADPKAVKDSSSCVYWDFDGAGGAGDWSNKGCERTRVYNNTIECACNHMTNFAALLDVYAETSKACGGHADALTMISYFGCLLSICGLSLTIFTYLFFRRLRKELAAKILIQLCIALLCVLVVFIVGIERSRVGPIGCYVVAVLLHYFILATFMWMLIEAHFMYLAFVKVWTHHGEHELLKCSFIAWGLPAIVVGVTMAVNLDNYGGDHYCRIVKVPFYAAFFAPILCIVFINLIVFGIILYKLNNRPDSSLGRERNATLQRMKQAVGIMILVGITWSFGALAISKARLYFHYLFAIFNSIQGFSIFVFYCLSQKNVRDSWKALLTCQLKKLQKDKSFYTNTYDRRRCSTASTNQNNTLSLARKKTSTSSGNTAYPTHSMDTLTREFTSFNCSSGSLTLSGGNKPSNLNNFITNNLNGKNGNPDVWKRMSNVLADNEPGPSRSLADIPPVLLNSNETLCSEDEIERSYSYDLVGHSNCGSVDSLDSCDPNLSQTSGKQGFYSFVGSRDSLASSPGDSPNISLHSEGISRSAPGTPVMNRPSPLSRKKQTTLPLSLERPNSNQVAQKHRSDQLSVPGDFGKLIVNPSRGSIRGVIGVVGTSVDTYDDDSPDLVTPQGVRLAQDFTDEKCDNFNPDQCITSPVYFAENNRVSRGSKDRNSSTNESVIGDIFL